MISSSTVIRVRYGETDRMGYVYYGNYALYFEVARVEMLRQLGIPYKRLEESGILLPVADYQVKYLKPVFYDDEITIKCTISKMPAGRIFFEYESYVGDDLVNTASTTLVFIDSTTNRPTRPPKEIQDVFTPYFD